MKKLPNDAYKALYNYVIDLKGYDIPEFDDYGRAYVNEDFEFDYKGYYMTGRATQIWRWVDMSFDHEFGIQYDYDIRISGLEELEIDNCLYYDENDNEERVDFDNSKLVKYLGDEDL